MSTIAILIFLAIFLAAVLAIALVLLQDAFVKINPGEVGLIIYRGKPSDKGLAPGTHFALRFARVIEIYPAVEITYLTLNETDRASTPENTITLTDPPLPVTLGDRTSATVQYTVRFKLTIEGLRTVHTRFGTTGVKGILRDESRRVLISAFGDESVTAADTLGARRTALEERIGERLGQELAACGFTLALFNLREVDLAETGAVIQSTLRANEELARERARGAVRSLRAEQEAEINALIAKGLSAPTLEYLRLQATRELIERWDGSILATPNALGLTASDGPTAPAAPAHEQASPPAEQ